MEISKYNKTELADISKILKKYRTLRKNVGKKSTNIIHHELSGENKILIEYFPTLVISDISKTAEGIYKSIFGIEIKLDKTEWRENKTIAGGIRLFYGDDMLDISFESIRNNLKKL